MRPRMGNGLSLMASAAAHPYWVGGGASAPPFSQGVGVQPSGYLTIPRDRPRWFEGKWGVAWQSLPRWALLGSDEVHPNE